LTDITHVEDQLQEATVAVDAAGTLIGQGQSIDLIGLERHVNQICATIGELPATQCANLNPALIMLIDGLNSLTRKLSAQHERVAGQLQGLSSHRKASSAYGFDSAKPGRSRND
jgi:hypothetical protein